MSFSLIKLGMRSGGDGATVLVVGADDDNREEEE